MHALIERIAARDVRIGVIGLGYVGLTAACALAEQRFRVTGLDIKADRVSRINNGQCPIEGNEPDLPELVASVVKSGALTATTDASKLSECEIVLINVETPVESDHAPRFEALKSACKSLGAVMRDGTLVIVESTVAPGTCERIVGPHLEAASGKKLNLGFFLAHCPERVMPGRLLKNLRELARVCGGSTPDTAKIVCALYKTIVSGDLDESDCTTAELVKTAENAFRDVNIAFANELATICEATGANFSRVRALVNKSPGRNVLLAGAGVGGHCIPKDPWLLAHAAENGHAPLLAAARGVNDGMPLHVATLVEDALRACEREVRGARIVVLGWAYLENSDDTRNSPSEVLVAALRNRGADVVIQDPWVPEYAGDVWAALEGADAAVIMVAHSAYRGIDVSRVKKLLRTPVLVDGRDVVDMDAAKAAGLTFRAIGRAGRRQQ